MSGDPDPLAVATQLRDLAADPLNRRAIVQDQGCLPGLILFLDHRDPQVVYAALLAIRYLAECGPNRDRLRAELGMMLSLQNLVHKTTTPGETKLLASEVYELLQAGPVQDQDQDQVQEPASTRRRAQFFLGSSNKRAKTLVLQVQGLEDPDLRSLCEEGLLKLRGVVSFTFQTASRRVVVRVRSDLQAEALAAAMGSTMAVQQVVRTQNGDEVLVPLSGSGPVQQNLDLPDYLPEDEGPAPAPDQALTRVGPGPDGTSWVGAAANFLSRSFYW